MREIFYIEDTPANKISYYLLLVFLVTLPFDRIYSELSLIGLLVHTLIHLTPRRLSFRWAGWLVAGLFLLMVLGSLYAPKWSDAGKQLEKQLAILLFPLIAWYSRLDWSVVRRPLLKGFAFSCFFTLIYLYGCAFIKLHNLGLPLTSLFTQPFLNHAFTSPLDLHATYFSMYVGIAMVVFIDRMVGAEREQGGAIGARQTKWKRWIYGLISLFLLLGLLQLASRAVCLAMLVVMNLLVPWFILKGKARWIVLGVFVLLSGIAVAVVVENDNLNERYLVQLKEDMQRVKMNGGDAEPRMMRWGCAWELIRQSPWIGYGTGAEVQRLKKEYYTHHLMIAYTHELNAHNQYLSYLLNAGFPAGLFYVLVLVSGGVIAFRRKDILFGSVIVLIASVSFSENILDTNKGIFFFSCFLTLFLYRPWASRSGVAAE